MAKVTVSGIAYRIPPAYLVKLTLSPSYFASLSTLKTDTEMSSTSSTSSTTPGTSLYRTCATSTTADYSGPGGACVLRHHTYTGSFSSSSGHFIGTGSTTINTSVTRQIVGVYFDASGAEKYIEIIRTITFTDHNAYTAVSAGGSINWTEGTVYNGTTCEDASDTAPPDMSLTARRNLVTEWPHVVQLHVDGVSVAEMSVYRRVEANEAFYASCGPGIHAATHPTIPGASSVYEFRSNDIADALTSADAPTLTAPAKSGAYIILGNIRIHAVRYSNNAWGLAALNLPGTLLGSCYIGGIYNLVTESRGADIGYTSDTSIDAVFARYVTIEPDTGSISQGTTGPRCYV
jgi:hypothetical protein